MDVHKDEPTPVLYDISAGWLTHALDRGCGAASTSTRRAAARGLAYNAAASERPSPANR